MRAAIGLMPAAKRIRPALSKMTRVSSGAQVWLSSQGELAFVLKLMNKGKDELLDFVFIEFHHTAIRAEWQNGDVPALR